jgi:uncharacterized glycosyltransferase HI_1578
MNLISNKLPLVSVLICVYNTEKYIEEAIRAVLNQTYSNLEVIIVNDGSTDSTLDILTNLALQDSRIKIINNKNNKGFINSLNIGIQHINSEYVARTDADDVTEQYWIEKIMKQLLSNKDIIAMGSYISILSENDSGKIGKHYKTGDVWETPLTHSKIIEKMLFKNPIHNNTMIVRSKVFKEHNLKFDLDYKHAEDYKFWFEVSKLGKLANYPEVLAYYRLHESQTSSLYNTEQVKTAKKIRREIISYYLDNIKIPNSIIEPITYKKVEEIIKNAKKTCIENKELLSYIIYESYLSLKEYNFLGFLSFLRYGYKFMSGKQTRRIIRKFIRPSKYEAPL